MPQAGEAVIALFLAACCPITPASVVGVDAPVGPFVAVAAGGGHVCGVRDDGTATCEGDDVPPVPQPPLVALATSSTRTCGIDDAGDLRCADRDGVSTEAGPFTEVAVSEDVRCAIREDGTVWCDDPYVLAEFPDVRAPWTGLVGASPDVFCAISAVGHVECQPDNHVDGVVDAVAVAVLDGVFDQVCVLFDDGGTTCGLDGATSIAMTSAGPVGVTADGDWLLAGAEGAPADGEEDVFAGDYAGVVATGALACGWRTDGGLDCGTYLPATGGGCR